MYGINFFSLTTTTWLSGSGISKTMPICPIQETLVDYIMSCGLPLVIALSVIIVISILIIRLYKDF